jgi:hypothetical protein
VGLSPTGKQHRISWACTQSQRFGLTLTQACF